MNKLTIFVFVVLLVLIGTLSQTKSIMLGGAKVVKLQSAPLFTSQISQAFTTTGGGALPVAGKDYSLENTQYFDSNQWVVTTIKPLSKLVTTGIVVLQQKNGVYEIFLGPGTSFAKSDTLTMPPSVADYLNQIGIIDESNAQ